MATFTQAEKVETLRAYFESRPQVAAAFLFGSRNSGLTHGASDRDIGIYFKTPEYLELEGRRRFSDEDKIWSDLVTLLGTDDIDLVVLNRVKPDLVYQVLRDGQPLIVRNFSLYWRLLLKSSYEALDWQQSVSEYWRIFEQARSLTPQARSQLQQLMTFLEEQWQDLEHFKNVDWAKYSSDRSERRNIERWVENLVMAALDVAKVVLASAKKTLPQTYQEMMKVFVTIYIDPALADEFAQLAKLRNIIAHEYLDLRWEKISVFVKSAERFYPIFFSKVKELLAGDHELSLRTF